MKQLTKEQKISNFITMNMLKFDSILEKMGANYRISMQKHRELYFFYIDYNFDEYGLPFTQAFYDKCTESELPLFFENTKEAIKNSSPIFD